VLSSSEIKTENLAEIITSSRADYLIVIGDKNMKNRSCQAKKRGKLVEMNVSIFGITNTRKIYFYQNTHTITQLHNHT
jgi:hypothetical protein